MKAHEREWLETRLRHREAELERCLGEIGIRFTAGDAFQVIIRRTGGTDRTFNLPDGPRGTGD